MLIPQIYKSTSKKAKFDLDLLHAKSIFFQNPLYTISTVID